MHVCSYLSTFSCCYPSLSPPPSPFVSLAIASAPNNIFLLAFLICVYGLLWDSIFCISKSLLQKRPPKRRLFLWNRPRKFRERTH